ncbi:MAG: peptidase dimerization domain-containing protein, partial [Syntrophomonadaceae bacterium]|nr:peptidase dimerization domain-containing protein [Syntrophomonadaceae bacterium]
GAKVAMVEAGAFEGIDAALMFHPGDSNAVEISSLAMEALEFTFWGKSVHAAACPQHGINALEALILFFNGINSLRQHLRDDVCIHGIIVEGGISPNVIPERAVARFYVRARQQGQLELAGERVKACAEGAAAMVGARVEWRNFEYSYQNMISNPTLAYLFRENLRLLGVRDLAGPREALGSIDMGNVSQVVPSLHPYLALNGKFIPHSREFARAAGSEIGEEIMMLAVKALASTALDLYLQPGLAERARMELQRSRGRRGE